MGLPVPGLGYRAPASLPRSEAGMQPFGAQCSSRTYLACRCPVGLADGIRDQRVQRTGGWGAASSVLGGARLLLTAQPDVGDVRGTPVYRGRLVRHRWGSA